MTGLRVLLLALSTASLLPAAATPQAGGDPPIAPQTWLDSAPARAFRQRVADLAVLYDYSSGLDPKGFLVEARRDSEVKDGCADVAIMVSQDGHELRQESWQGCKRS